MKGTDKVNKEELLDALSKNLKLYLEATDDYVTMMENNNISPYVSIDEEIRVATDKINSLAKYGYTVQNFTTYQVDETTYAAVLLVNDAFVNFGKYSEKLQFQ